MKKELMNAMAKVKLNAQKHSPGLLLGAGILGGITTVIVACKKTIEVKDVVDTMNNDISEIEEPDKTGKSDDEINAMVEAYKKEKASVYVHAGFKIVKLYLPAIALGSLSITSLLASHNIVKKRNIALSIACNTITNDFKEYRNNVIERYGEEVDTSLKHGIVKEKIERIVTDDDGKEKKVKETVEIANPNPYAYVFKKGNPNWSSNMDYNIQFIKAQESYFNDVLVSRKLVFLNDVTDELGFERSRMGQEVGWKYDSTDPNADGKIDFRAHLAYEKDEFGNIEPVILLDFNVDGAVIDSLK